MSESTQVADLAAVVVTHRREQQAGALVRALIEGEGIPAERIVVVVDHEGGLDDPALERRVRLLRQPRNLGPAPAFARGIEEALRLDPVPPWLYLCEDDVLVDGLPVPRLAGLLAAVRRHRAWEDEPIGAVVAHGRRLIPGQGATSEPHVPRAEPRLQQVDVAAWGATLLNADVARAGVLPDDSWYFGYEDFDFFLSLTGSGFLLLADRDSERVMATTPQTRARARGVARAPEESEEWRAYYVARNYLELARRHGGPGWVPRHLIKSARRFQLAGSAATRKALLHGLFDGLRGRTGRVERYVRPGPQ